MAESTLIQVTMPEMGESVTEGTVLEWHVAVGDVVEEGQTLVEVSTDKVDAEVPAPKAGRITGLLAEPDDEVAVGAGLAELDPSDTEGAGPPARSRKVLRKRMPAAIPRSKGNARSIPARAARPRSPGGSPPPKA